MCSPRTLPGRCERSAAAATVTPPAPRARRSTIAAAPSFGEHSMYRVSGSQTSGEASTDSSVNSLRNIAYGLSTPLRWFFTDTCARCWRVTPESRISLCARSAK